LGSHAAVQVLVLVRVGEGDNESGMQAPSERAARLSRTPGRRNAIREVGLLPGGRIGRLERDLAGTALGAPGPGIISGAGGTNQPRVGLPGPHAQPVAATGSWSSTTTMDVDDDDDGLGVGEGAKIPSSARCRPLPCWSPATTCGAEPRAGPNHPVSRGMSGHDRWVSTPQNPIRWIELSGPPDRCLCRSPVHAATL